MRKSSPEFRVPSELERIKFDVSFFEKPAEKILDLLRTNIDQLKYDSILGDDTAGRIPALILSRAMRDIYGDRKHLETFFVKGGKLLHDKSPFALPSEYDTFIDSLSDEENEKLEALSDKEYEEFRAITHKLDDTQPLRQTTHAEEVASYLERIKPKLGQNTLLVTEEILSGSSIDILASILRSKGINVDVVSFGIADSEDVENDTFTTEAGTRILLGSTRLGPTIPEKALGVWSDGRSGSGYAVKRQPFSKEETKMISAARKESIELGHKLASNYTDGGTV